MISLPISFYELSKTVVKVYRPKSEISLNAVTSLGIEWFKVTCVLIYHLYFTKYRISVTINFTPSRISS